MNNFRKIKLKVFFIFILISSSIIISGCFTLEKTKKGSPEIIPHSKQKTGKKIYTFETIQNPTINNPEVKIKLEQSNQYKVNTKTKVRYYYSKNIKSSRKNGGWSLGIGLAALAGGIIWAAVVPSGYIGSTGNYNPSTGYTSYWVSNTGRNIGIGILIPTGAILSVVGICILAAKHTKVRYKKLKNYEYYFESYPLKKTEIAVNTQNKFKMFKTNEIGLMRFNLLNDFEFKYFKHDKPIQFTLKYRNLDFDKKLELKPSLWLNKYAHVLSSNISIWNDKNYSSTSIGNARIGLEYKVIDENLKFKKYKIEIFKNKYGWVDFRDVSIYCSNEEKTNVTATIKRYVEKKMTEWQKQGEFESPDDYFNRIATREVKLKELTYDAMGLYQNDYINMISWNEAKISRYDPNSQTFKIDIPEISEFVLQVPIYFAQTFKKNWDKKKIKNQKFILVDGNWELSSLEIKVPEVNQTIEYNSDLIYSYNPVNQFSFELEPLEIDLSTNNSEFDDLAAIKYDISINLPKTNMSNTEAVAVVIGNTNYKYTSNVDYAINDAQLVKTYLVNVLGYKPGNVLFYKNASKADFEGLFGTKDNYKGKLYNFLKAGISDVLIFYSGHGAPGLNDQKGYFVPVDCDPLYVELQGYNSDILYNNLATVSAKSVTVITDACFSGADIIDNISSIIPKVQQPIFKIKNGSLLSSSSTDEVACWLKQQQHGLFTYFFLKALHDYKNSDINDDSKLTLNEIYNYVSNNSNGVPYYARRLNAKEQHPTLVGNKEKIFIEY